MNIRVSQNAHLHSITTVLPNACYVSHHARPALMKPSVFLANRDTSILRQLMSVQVLVQWALSSILLSMTVLLVAKTAYHVNLRVFVTFVKTLTICMFSKIQLTNV